MLTNEQIDLIYKALAANKNTDGILLCGSYAYGQPTDASDLDLRVVTNDGSNFDGRGLRLFDTDIELLVNSPERIRRYFQVGLTTGIPYAIHFWTYGTIILDRSGILAELQKEASLLWHHGPNKGTWRHKKTRTTGRVKYSSEK